MSKQFANRDVSNLVIEKLDGTPYAFIDYANVTAVDMTGEVVYAYGGQGHPKKVSFSGDRGGTLRVESQITDGNLYSMLTGAEVETSASFIKRAEVTGAVSGSDPNFTYTFQIDDDYAGGTITVYPAASDLDLATAYKGKATVGTASQGKRTVTWVPDTDAAVFANNAPLVVWYNEALTDVVKLNLQSTTFPKAVRIYGQTWDKSTDDKIVEEHMIAYKAVPQPTFTITNQNTGDPGTLTITYDLLEDDNKNIFDLIFVDEDKNA